ncbi:MAG: hypothetical protein ACRC2S_00370 [Waterburya sp.]
MVDRKRRKIAKKPPTQSFPDPDSWISSGGVDPEIKTSLDKNEEVEKKVVSSSNEKATERTPDGAQRAFSVSSNKRTYPHRISFDMDASQYKRLKWASFDSESPMNNILREAVEEWMKSRGY